MCVCLYVCKDTCGNVLTEHSGGAAVIGDWLSLLQIWKWPEENAVTLIILTHTDECTKMYTTVIETPFRGMLLLSCCLIFSRMHSVFSACNVCNYFFLQISRMQFDVQYRFTALGF